MLSLRLSDCIERFVAWTAANRRPKTADHYRYQLGKFAAQVDGLLLSDLTPALVASTCKGFHRTQAVQRLCSWCHRHERSVAVNPLHGMPKARMGQRRRVLDRAQVVKLMRSADRIFRPFLIFLIESMCRPQEARLLAWADTWTRGEATAFQSADTAPPIFFSLHDAKGFDKRSDQSVDRIIPISPRLARLLARLSRDGVTLGDTILKDSRGRPWTSNAVRCRFRRLRLRAGLAPDRRGERVVAYTLRHTGATNAAAAGVRDFRLAGLLGHASPRTTERYVHLRPADLVDAAKVVWETKRERTPKNDRPG